MKIGVPRETATAERRVALVPGIVASLTAKDAEVLVEPGAGIAAGFPDAAYTAKGAKIVAREELFAAADVLVRVRGGESRSLRPGQAVIGFLDPLGSPRAMEELARTGTTAFSIELMPRITRAQSMDALSSQATVAGYKAVLLAAERLPRMFPMLMTAAGTITPARVFVLGAGVAGLQAIATAKRLGAVVQAYDVRPAVKEQVQSVGAKFVELPLDTAAAEGAGGYAAAQDESFYKRQREVLGKVVAASDVVITTAAIPGQKSPVLIMREMVESMAPGSVIVDLAAERGGNCEATRADEVVDINGVTVLGPTNLPGTVPYHASQMYAKNISALLLHLLKDGKLVVDLEDEITRETLVTQGGEVVHERVKKLLAEGGKG
ncbi:MAG TPA: Re/Si-specific NAD(P)(+) transhydrogenase subunit alpha [Gemmatimonadaceae bacterium]|nr:Re/Si-specific NAD(P)(+) transhydrogenase subunit alpha [Gemmatimonadaceae bacterium]